MERRLFHALVHHDHLGRESSIYISADVLVRQMVHITVCFVCFTNCYVRNDFIISVHCVHSIHISLT